MLKRKILSAVCGLAAIAAAAPALAVMSVPFGWYLEGNVGSSHLSNVSYSGSSSSSGIGGSGFLGYKFMPYLAMEAGYTQYANSSIKDNTDTKAASVKHYSYGLAGRGILPIADSGFELFGKVGVQRINAKTSISNETAANNLGISSSQHNTTGLLVGAGAQYYMMPELAVNGQWQRAQGNSNTGTEDLFSVGLSFIFD